MIFWGSLKILRAAPLLWSPTAIKLPILDWSGAGLRRLLPEVWPSVWQKETSLRQLWSILRQFHFATRRSFPKATMKQGQILGNWHEDQELVISGFSNMLSLAEHLAQGGSDGAEEEKISVNSRRGAS